MKKNNEKTNVMRVFDQNKISYKSYCYVDSGVISGIEVASVLNPLLCIIFFTKIYVFFRW